MLFSKLTKFVGLACLIAVIGCSPDAPVGVPAPPADGPRSADKDGSEALGPPSLVLASGSGIAHGGVSMVGVSAADLSVTVPENAAIRQVLLYWAGGSVAETGDDQISLDGVPVQGQLIGGPTWFYYYAGGSYRFSAYRADITALGLVGPGTNTLTVSGFDFAMTLVDENDGASLVVIWDDGSQAGIQVRDGLDMAYFGFDGVLNNTVPQTFAVTPASVPRLADLVLLAASVGSDRPNRVIVTTSAGVQVFDDPLGQTDGAQWDSLELPVLIPAGVAAVTVQLVSTVSFAPKGASLGWVCAALAEPAAGGGPTPWSVSGTVYVDTDSDGAQDPTEIGLPGVAVDLAAPVGATGLALSALTDADGRYAFAVPAGDYTVAIDLAAHAGSFNADLAASFNATGPLQRAVTVGPDSAGNDFGFKPDTTRLLADLQAGVILTDGLTQGMWRQIFRCAMLAEEQSGYPGEQDGALQRLPMVGDDCGVELQRLFYDADTLRQLLASVSGLFLPEPYQFAEGFELTQALKLLSLEPRDTEEALLQELLATELNYVTGRGTVNQLDLMASLAGWAESLLVWQEEGPVGRLGEKGRAADLYGALILLEAVNTGGGGGVDEK